MKSDHRPRSAKSVFLGSIPGRAGGLPFRVHLVRGKAEDGSEAVLTFRQHYSREVGVVRLADVLNMAEPIPSDQARDILPGA